MIDHKSEWNAICQAQNVRCFDFVFHGFCATEFGFKAIYTRFNSGEEIRLALEENSGRPIINRLKDPTSNGGQVAGRCAYTYFVNAAAA